MIKTNDHHHPPPATDIITKEDLKPFLGIDGDEQDDAIDICIKAALPYAEDKIDRAIAPQTREVGFHNGFPSLFYIEPFQSIESIKYRDSDGNYQEFTDFETAPDHGLITGCFPYIRAGANSVVVRYVAGFSDREIDAITPILIQIAAEMYNGCACPDASDLKSYRMPNL